MSIFAGDELYDDDVTSGPGSHGSDGPYAQDDFEFEDDDDLSGEFSDVAQGRWDYD